MFCARRGVEKRSASVKSSLLIVSFSCTEGLTHPFDVAFQRQPRLECGESVGHSFSQTGWLHQGTACALFPWARSLPLGDALGKRSRIDSGDLVVGPGKPQVMRSVPVEPECPSVLQNCLLDESGGILRPLLE